MVILFIVLLVGAYVFYQKKTGRIFIDDSLVAAPVITISPTNAGKVTEMDAYDGEEVKKGDTLAIVSGNTIHADTDGLIISAANQTGGSVSPQTQLIQMIRPVDLRVAGTIDENKGLDQIKVGQVASFTIDAFPGKTYWGFVDEVSPSAKQTQISFSISNERPTQQFVVYVRYDHTRYPEIKNGMSAKMTVYTRTQSGNRE